MSESIERRDVCVKCGQPDRHLPTCDFWKKDVTGSDAVLDSERVSTSPATAISPRHVCAEPGVCNVCNSIPPATVIAEGGLLPRLQVSGFNWDEVRIGDSKHDQAFAIQRAELGSPYRGVSPIAIAKLFVELWNTRASRTPLPQPDPWARFKEMIRIANTRPCPACQHSDVASDGLCAASVPLIDKEPHGSKRCGCPCVNLAWQSESTLPEDDQESGGENK